MSGYQEDFFINKLLPVGINIEADTYTYAEIQGVNSSNNTLDCKITFPSSLQGTVKNIKFVPYLLNLTDMKNNIPITLGGNTSIYSHKTGQIEAADFIETEDNQILLQKGGRIWSKEFVENSAATDIFYKNDYSITCKELKEV